MDSIAQLEERVLKPKDIVDGNELIKQKLQLMNLICTGPAIQTLQEVSRLARQNVIEDSLDEIDDDESVTHEILNKQRKSFL